MNKERRRWLGWVLGAVVLALILLHLTHSAQWRAFNWGRLGSMLIHADATLLILAVCISYGSYFVRAYRWKFFVDPLKKCSFRVLFDAQVIGFSSIYLIGRAGEIVRPAYIAKAETVPFTSQLAVWVIERIYDCLALAVLLALALYFEPIHVAAGRESLLRDLHAGAVVVLALCGVAVACLAAYRIYSEQVVRAAERVFRFAPERRRGRILNLLRSFSAGLGVIQNLWDFSATVALTVLLWTVNVTVLWLIVRSVGGRAAVFSWWAAALTAFLGALGLTIQLPGVGGGYQVAMLLALEDFYHLTAEGAASAAILTWVAVMIPCLILGVILVIAGGLSFRKLQMMAEAEQAKAGTPKS